MHRSKTNRPAWLASQQALDDFGRKGGKGGQAAEETGDREQFPSQREMRVEVKQADSHANQIAADHVGSQRAQRQRNEERVQGEPKQPARPCAKGGAKADSEEIQGGKMVQRRHG